MSVQSDLYGQKTRSIVPDWDFISSLLSGNSPLSGPSGRGNPSSMVPGGPRAGKEREDAQQTEEVQYFPGKSQTVEGDATGAFVQLTSADKASFYASLDLNMTPSLAGLCAAICMVASRYSKEPSVLGELNDPASAGIPFISLFTRFRQQATNRDDTVIATQSYLLASMYHCVDHLPHTLAHGFLGEAVARCYDGGLHRWDKQLAAICGRPPLMRLYDFDVSLPTTTDMSGSADRVLTIFNQFILLNALLEKTLAASIQRPVFDNSQLLTRLSEESDPKRSRDDALPAVERNLQKWSEELPDWICKSMDYWTTLPLQEAMSIYELKSTVQLIHLLLAGRRMQLATSDRLERPDDIHREGPTFATFRAKVQECAKALISICIALGSNNMLPRADIKRYSPGGCLYRPCYLHRSIKIRFKRAMPPAHCKQLVKFSTILREPSRWHSGVPKYFTKLAERPEDSGIQSKKSSPLPFDLGIPYAGILGDNLEWLFPGGMPTMDAA
ncbi:hypothetical protein QFC20_004034 [Naganishia adeliensis]|uniref:Uncharacterized protein n=1 Tax=Naganishia adeliensis TaxID=92952 RepID=A0ACC2W4Q8_9TREE|nr:hypothetical protein QFC20_004034 [Naganishia adeliensis]